MAADTSTDADDQDLAEVFDEEATGGDKDQETTYPYDRDRSVRDETTARGDADLEGDDDALDADEEDDEQLDDLADEDEEDDLDDDDRDVGALDVDDIPDFTADKDFPDANREDGVAARASDEADVVSMGDLSGVDSASSTADYESDDLSDADLKELDYMDTPEDEDRVRTKGGEAPDADKAADALPPGGGKSAKRDDQRLDQGLEETFPASDPVSAKHIT